MSIILSTLPGGPAQSLLFEHEFTDRRSVVRTRPLHLDFASRLGQLGSTPASVPPFSNRVPKLCYFRSAVTSFWYLAAMPPEGSASAGIVPGRPSLDRGSRGAEVGRGQ
ncbi:hypothetical protein T265_09202 [Opisthorchis viverrini]|uniref:Uncharacterized protein n=1 Tax=Opisthorchis viverrini TaxID=6198 RepID=A0A074ZHN0_OPIVI|nr:hypothetical protein T265_09202 [Opisthorchis viverrini]KER22755.1 hypothetical protein T265_09202 [Opisthorchis viverrini]